MNETCNEGTHGPFLYILFSPAMQVQRKGDEGDEGEKGR
jgi:hypothetical protein